MILCIDLDDTIALTGRTIIKYATNFNKKILKRKTKITKITDCEDYYYFAKMFNWERNDLIEFFSYCYPEYLNKVKLKKKCKKYLFLLRKKGFKIYIVTSRRETTNNYVKKITKEWLEKNGIIYDELYINIIDKAELLKKIKPDYYIDDSKKNCDLVYQQLPNTKVFLMNTKYNNNLVSNHVRINNIKEFYDFIKECL